MKRFLSLILCIVMLFVLCACAGTPVSPATQEEGEASAEMPSLPEAEDTAQTFEPTAEPADKEADEDQTPEGMIYLYGEHHWEPYCMEQELEAWEKLYENGARHLFIEFSPAWAVIYSLNISGDEETIDLIYGYMNAERVEYDAASADEVSEEGRRQLLLEHCFLQAIKEHCPETIFHGIDVEHDYDDVGPAYLAYLESIGQQDGEEYARELLACEQGRISHSDTRDIYEDDDNAYRENCMAENFTRDLEKLETQDVMGIFGGAHVELGAMNWTPSGDGATVYNMATQLQQRYGDRVVSTILATKNNGTGERPDPIGPITVNGKTYETSYVAEHDYSAWAMPYKQVVYWRLMDSNEDFADSPAAGELDPFLLCCDADAFIYYSVYMAECTMWDDSVEHIYFISGPTRAYKSSSPVISVREG